MSESFDYTQLAQAMREVEQREIDTELAKPEWNLYRSQVPSLNEATAEQRRAAFEKLKPAANRSRVIAEQEAERVRVKQQQTADFNADRANIQKYQAEWNSYAANPKNVAKPARPTLANAYMESDLNAIDNGQNAQRDPAAQAAHAALYQSF